MVQIGCAGVLAFLIVVSSACSGKKKKTTPQAGAEQADTQKRQAGLPSGAEGPTAAEKQVFPEGVDAEPGLEGEVAPDSADQVKDPSPVEVGEKVRIDTGEEKPVSAEPVRDPKEAIRKNLKEAQAALRKGNNDRAVELARAVLVLDERNADAMVVTATAYMRKKQLELARAVLGFLASVDSENADGYHLAAQLALKDGEMHRARLFFERAVERNPRLGDAWSRLCTWYVQGKNWRESDPEKKGKDAMTACSRAVELRSSSYRDRLNLGNVYRGIGNLCRPSGMERCEEQQAQCIRANPQNTGPCEEAFQKCSERIPGGCRSVEAKNFQMARDAYTRANGLFQEALRKSGKRASPYPAAIYNLGVLYLDAPEFPGETGISRLNKAKAYLNQYLQVADPRAAREERKAVMALIARADNLIMVEKAREEARRAQEEAEKAQ